jgi:hypothetical protein
MPSHGWLVNVACTSLLLQIVLICRGVRLSQRKRVTSNDRRLRPRALRHYDVQTGAAHPAADNTRLLSAVSRRPPPPDPC